MKLSRIMESCMYTSNLENTKAFYLETLGVDLYSEAKGRHVFFKMPDGSMLLFFDPKESGKEGQALPSHSASGPQHLAFEVPVGEYEAWKDKLAKATVTIVQEKVWDKGAKSFYFRDPNGHLLEICQPGIWG